MIVEAFVHFVSKLFMGNPVHPEPDPQSTLSIRVQNLKAIWNNVHHNDTGIERLMRLVFALVQFVLPHTYIKEFSGRVSIDFQEFCDDLYMIVRLGFPLLLLSTGWHSIWLLHCLQMVIMVETLFSLPSLIFASDTFPAPRSYRRVMLMALFDFVSVIFCFAVVYAEGAHLNKIAEHWFDYVYFSTMTTTTIGYGDYSPITLTGKVIVSVQAFLSWVFVAIFFTVFSSKIELTGFFNRKAE